MAGFPTRSSDRSGPIGGREKDGLDFGETPPNPNVPTLSAPKSSGPEKQVDGYGTNKEESMKAVVFYETNDAPMEKIMAIFPRHKAQIDAYHARGEILAVGAWENPREGAMGVFRDREAADRFVKEDPFVLEGVIGKVTVKNWNESLLGT
jgi:uncharacterized protein YciI